MRKDRTGRVPFVDYFPGFLHLMGNHGWIWETHAEEGDEHYFFTKTVLSNDYKVKVNAIVYSGWKHLDESGHYGVAWLDFVDYPDCTIDKWHGLTIHELEDIIHGMILAEEDLVRCGIPFVPDYHFHGPNAWNMKRRNDATRKRLNIDHWEERDWNRKK